jgi:ferrochelatase
MNTVVNNQPPQQHTIGPVIGGQKTAVLLMNLGGPDTVQAVEPFLFNLFRDPDIFKLPFSFVTQRLFAWLISSRRAPKVIPQYEEIGGGSPILKLTQAQADAVEDLLKNRGFDVPVRVAMRYWHPLTEDVTLKLYQEGYTHLVVLPLYPHYSCTTTGSSLNELRRVLKKASGSEAVKLSVIPSFWDNPKYLQGFANTIAAGLAAGQWSCPLDDVTVLFSAHSLPRKFVKKNNDPYPEQIEACAKALMQQYFPKNSWELGYQSKVGNLVWIGPQTDGLLHYFAATNTDNILMVPISFVSDHLETLFEIDLEYIPLAHELGLNHCHRAPALNNEPMFIEALADLIIEQLSQAAVPHLQVSQMAL